uniref:CDP-diacylglycerol--inositol 3-phosphatidyltransferase n=1 Tax=Coturnix japonica TaxID=93934 RepID=A0A8C2SSK3_COTJA
MGLPHISGYIRVVLSAVSFLLMPHSPVPAAVCYGLSAALDAVDGLAARWLNQGSRLGAMLDMLTDRCSLLCLQLNLALLYPMAAPVLQLSLCLDVASHWLHMHTWAGLRGRLSLPGNPTARDLWVLLCALWFYGVSMGLYVSLGTLIGASYGVYGSLWAVYGALWGSMGLYGALWVSMVLNVSLWASMCLSGALSGTMGLYGVSMGHNGVLWGSMGSLWGSYGDLWVSMCL